MLGVLCQSLVSLSLVYNRRCWSTWPCCWMKHDEIDCLEDETFKSKQRKNPAPTRSQNPIFKCGARRFHGRHKVCAKRQACVQPQILLFLLSSGVNARTYTTFPVFLSEGRGRWEELRCLRIPPAVQSRDISDSHLSSRSAAFPGRW